MLLILFLVILSSINVLTQDIKSSVQLTSNAAFRFQPTNDIELLQSFEISSLIRCSSTCVANRQCRTFDYDPSAHLCRLFESSIDTGTMIDGTCQVGNIILDARSFVNIYNTSCLSCVNNRYFVCNSDGTCQCPLHTFWNDTMCQNQLYQGSWCSMNESCRDDLGLICTMGNTCDIPTDRTLETSTNFQMTDAVTSATLLFFVSTQSSACNATQCTETLMFWNTPLDFSYLDIEITIKKTATLVDITSVYHTFNNSCNVTTSSYSSHYLIKYDTPPSDTIEATNGWNYTIVITLDLSDIRSGTEDTYKVTGGVNSSDTQTMTGYFT